MKVLVTGAAGMIGSQCVEALKKSGYEVVGVDRREGDGITVCDLGEKEKLAEIARSCDRVIHLAALAHTAGEADLSYERYYHVNVECAANVFEAAKNAGIPVLFISTVDVYGFTKGTVGPDTEPHPVTSYGKTKRLAEEALEASGAAYTIYRFSPVYTDTVKRDIQKRYYLKYPKIAYQIGKGTFYEILNIRKAVQEMADWCGREPANEIRIIKDDAPMWTPDCIRAEKAEGRAKTVLHFPRWMVSCGYHVLLCLTGKNSKTYLLNKAVDPLKTESL